MISKLAEILFKDYRRRVLALLLLNPKKRYHVREIARITGTVAGTMHKELARLAEAGILAREKMGNQVQYFADQNCPVFDELSSILRKTTGLVDVLANALVPLEDRIAVALVFGSMARAREISSSDVDLLVIGHVEFADVVKVVYPCQDILQREINPKVYTQKEWKLLRVGKDNFSEEVIKQPMLFIIGTQNELG